jgi:hypothetical protein
VVDDARKYPSYPLRLPKIDINVANTARTWNYMVGGKDNFAADREAARQLVAVAPVIALAALASRAFLRRTVRYLVAEAGIWQFLDIGTGLPTAGNTHEVAQFIRPECRVVYVDNDPVVLTHARALLTSAPEGTTSYIDADARDPHAIIAEAAKTLDFGQPAAVILMDLLNFIRDDTTVSAIMSTVTDAVSSGSYVALMHPASDMDHAMLEAERRWNRLASQKIRLRPRQQIAGWLAGLDLVEPGLVTVSEWRPDSDEPQPGQPIPCYGAVARNR